MTKRGSRDLLSLERFLGALSLCALGYVFLAYWSASVYAAKPSEEADIRKNPLVRSRTMGRIEIPDLSLSVPILNDDDPQSLTLGVGHIPGTALPGGLGTVGLAGHRDTYFRPLRRLKPNMDVRLVGDKGIYRYQTDSIEIVSPERVDVLATDTRPSLVLVTCFPFDFIGAAPKRFVIHAHLLSVSPASSIQNSGAF
jgi:sortase A